MWLKVLTLKFMLIRNSRKAVKSTFAVLTTWKTTYRAMKSFSPQKSEDTFFENTQTNTIPALFFFKSIISRYLVLDEWNHGRFLRFVQSRSDISAEGARQLWYILHRWKWWRTRIGCKFSCSIVYTRSFWICSCQMLQCSWRRSGQKQDCEKVCAMKVVKIL